MRLLIPLVTLFLVIISSSVSAKLLTDPSNKHNLSSASSNEVHANTETRICVFCHTPHGASAESELWNRNDPDPTTNFPLYNTAPTSLHIDDAGIVGTTGYTAADQSTYPNGATRMCLSCHDGVSAIGEVLNGLDGFTPQIAMTIGTLSGRSSQIDLATSHPVSFVYNSVVDGAVVSYLNAQEGGVGVYSLPSVLPLDNSGRMQCTTCHDPHTDTRVPGTYDLPFWRNFGSGDTADYDSTCLDCHSGSDWGVSWPGPGVVH